MDRVQVIRSARALGFTVREIRALVEDGQPATPVAERWRVLARRKLPELQVLMGRAAKMKRLLRSGLTCDCVRIDERILHECSPPVTLTRSRAALHRAAGP